MCTIATAKVQRNYNCYNVYFNECLLPNHVHLLLSPIGEEVSTRFIGSVKQYTANAINQALGRKGQVWQRNFFDRLVRDGYNFEAYVNYINQNPRYLPPDSYTLGGTL